MTGKSTCSPDRGGLWLLCVFFVCLSLGALFGALLTWVYLTQGLLWVGIIIWVVLFALAMGYLAPERPL